MGKATSIPTATFPLKEKATSIPHNCLPLNGEGNQHSPQLSSPQRRRQPAFPTTAFPFRGRWPSEARSDEVVLPRKRLALSSIMDCDLSVCSCVAASSPTPSASLRSAPPSRGRHDREPRGLTARRGSSTSCSLLPVPSSLSKSNSPRRTEPPRKLDIDFLRINATIMGGIGDVSQTTDGQGCI